MTRYSRKLVQKAEQELVELTPLCLEGLEHAADLALLLDSGFPDDSRDVRSHVAALREILEKRLQEKRCHNTRVNMGILVRSLPEIVFFQELVEETVDDPQLHDYLLDSIQRGDTYDGTK